VAASISDNDLEKLQGKRASVYAVRQALIVVAQSGRGLMGTDPDSFHSILAPAVDDATLGAALLGALSSSRFLQLEEAKQFLHESRDKRWDSWTDTLIQATGFRSKQKLFERMAQCSVTAQNGTITFSPTVKRRGAAWEGLGKEFESSIDQASSPNAIGRALGEALMRCLPEVVRRPVAGV